MRPDGSAALGPRIDSIFAKLKMLERRADHLRQRIAESRGNERSRDFDRSEIDALEAACAALRYHAAALYADTDPTLALAELIDSLEIEDDDRIDAALARGKRILRELGRD